MKSIALLQKTRFLRAGLILASLLLALVTGAMPLLWSSSLAPLVVFGVLIGVAGAIVLLLYPVWGLYLTIFLSLLPPADAGGASPLLSISIDLALLLTFLALLLKCSFQNRKIVLKSTISIMAIFLLWSAVTLFWSSDLVIARQSLVQYILFACVLFLVVNLIDTQEALDGLMFTLALNGWVLLLAGVGTVLFTGYKLSDRLVVFNQNSNTYGLVLLMTTPGVLWKVIRSSGRKKIINIVLSFIFIVLSLISIALSGSRGSAGSLALTLLLFLCWRKTRAWGMLGLIIGLASIIIAPFVFSNIIVRFTEDDSSEGGALGGRVVLWQASIALIQEHPWGGMGVGNGAPELINYVNPLTDAFAKRDAIPSHNPFLEVAIDSGIPGVLLFAMVLLSAVWLYIRQYYHFQKSGGSSVPANHTIAAYFAVITCVAIGYMFSWIKSGGIKSSPTYMIFLAFAILPSRLAFRKTGAYSAANTNTSMVVDEK